MAETSFHKKHHNYHCTFIPILFFISLILILLVFFTTQNTLHLFYPDLFSYTVFSSIGATQSSKASSFDDTQQNQVPIEYGLAKDLDFHGGSVPILDGLGKDSNFGGEKAENGVGMVPISNGVSKDSNFDVGKVANGDRNVPISNGVLKYSNFDVGNGENGDRNVPISNGVSKDANFVVGNAEKGDKNVLISNGVPKDSNFDGEKVSKDSEFDGINAENEVGIVSLEKKENPGFVDGSGNVGAGNVEEEEGTKAKGCNLYTGKWVRDEGYPVYKPGSCPYVDEAFDCQTNGRPDSDYLKWRWKPDDCDLPRFNATDFLVRLRGKSLMLVGDSMNRNQFESMLCLLREGLADKSKMYEVHGYKITKGRGFYVFKFVDYNCTIVFVRSHFLVKEGIRINGQGNSNPTLSIDKIDKTAAKWKRADILIFNTAHWWTHGKTSRGKNYFKEGDHVYPKFDAVEAYRRAMKTWANWIDKNVDPARQLVFYRAYSSAHFRGGDWDSGGTCNGETDPISSGAFLDSYPVKMKIVEDTIQKMRIPVILLNVTRLTNFRKDGHPSIYGKVRTSGAKVSARKQDCSHWCLPGVPDAWNELIYASLVFQQTGSSRVP